MTKDHANETAAQVHEDDLRRRAADDLKAARTLAEAGRRAPLLGGEIYVIWGLAVAAALLVQWAIVVRLLDLSPWAIPVSWFALTGAAALVSSRFRAARLTHPGAAGVGNTVSGAVWRAAGLFLGVFAVTLFAAGLASPFDADASGGERGRWIAAGFAMFTPASFGVYAIAMEASAAAAQAPWLRNFSRLSFAAMAATVVTAGAPIQHLIAAAGVITSLVLPGVLMMRRAQGKSDD